MLSFVWRFAWRFFVFCVVMTMLLVYAVYLIWYSAPAPDLAKRIYDTTPFNSETSAFLSLLLGPGDFVLTAFRINLAGRWLIIPALLSWWIYVTALRLACCIPARSFGVYNPNHFHKWLWLWLPWRPLWRVMGKAGRWREEVFSMGKRATAKWTGLLETLTLVYRPGDIFLGRLWAFGLGWLQPIGISGERHLAMIAGAGSGKTTLLMTLLGLQKGTAFVIDPKGQIARAMALRCGQGGNGIIGKNMKVAVLDPFGIVQEEGKSASWNPFEEIDRAVQRLGSDAAVHYAAKIADGLIVKYGKESDFWAGTSKELLLGLILHIHTTEPPESRNLIRLYDLLCNGLPDRAQGKETGFGALLREMSQNTAYGGAIAASANTLADTGNDTYGNVLISTREQLQWLKLPQVRAVCSHSTFYLEELKTGKLNLFVCAPVTDLQGPLAGWFRLLAVLGLYTFESIPGRPKYSCLFALDEFPSLGNIKAIETAAPVMRSIGLVPIFETSG